VFLLGGGVDARLLHGVLLRPTSMRNAADRGGKVVSKAVDAMAQIETYRARFLTSSV